MGVLIEDISLDNFDLGLSQMRMISQIKISQMEKSLSRHGQLQPVIVRRHAGYYQIIDGFKRYYASKNLMYKSLQCMGVEVDLAQAKVLLLSYNRSHQTMEAWEQAMVLYDLKTTHHYDLQCLCSLTGYSRSWVSRRLSMTEKLDGGVCQQIKMGSLTSSHARELMRLPRGNQASMSGVIIAQGLSSRQSASLISAFIRAKNTAAQQYVLNNPFEVLRRQLLDEQEVYEPRLSGHGNELLKTARYLKKSLDIMTSRLLDHKTNDLEETEKRILFDILYRIGKSCERIRGLIKQLQTN